MAQTCQIDPYVPRVFATTRWALLQACGHVDQTLARQALEELCQAYWYPVYAMIRRTGKQPEDAQDLTQDFFVKLLKGRWLAQLDQSKGRFRSYLATALQHFLRDSHRRRWTLRRGRAYTLVSIDAVTAENQYALEPMTEATPETLYEKKWAATVIANAIEQLRIELTAERKPDLFDCFRGVVFCDAEPAFYENTAARLQMKVGALHQAMSRLRRRLRTLLREEVARTLTSRTEAEISEEIQHLMRVVAARGNSDDLGPLADPGPGRLVA